MAVENFARIPGGTDVKIIQGAPPTFTVHQVSTEELNRLKNSSSPWPLALAGIFIGALFSLLPSTIDALHKVGTANFDVAALLWCLLDGGAFLLSIISGFVAVRDRRQVNAILKQIEGRLGAEPPVQP